jgi:cell division protein ZapE
VSGPDTSAARPAGHANAAADDLLCRYEAEVAARHFRRDPVQLQALARLDELRTRLIAATPAGAQLRARALLGTLLGRGRWPPVRGLYLWGGVGRGKTWLMDLFYASLPVPARRRHFHRFMHEVHGELTRLRQRRAPLELVAARIAHEARVLCFDELYVADIADAMILAGLFEGLLRRGVTLVATSNVAPQGLYRNGLQRERFLPAIALLERHLDVMELAGGPDYRLRQLTQAGVYLKSGEPETAARLAALFQELGGAGAQLDGSIQIEGRAIPVVRAAHGVLWCAFGVLCGGARSQDDYIEIAREYQSLIVSDVPVFDAAHEDEARRFIALVDELYDRNVNLVLSAAAPPAQLYQGASLKAPFARTVSRLTEMQSEEYLRREHRP